MKKAIAVMIAVGALIVASHAQAQLLEAKKAPFTEVSESERLKQVNTLLTDKSDVLVVYAKGLCCPSCAIGIRKMVSGLDFVETSGANKGVELDPKFQLVTFKIKKGKTLSLAKISRAIEDAGYDPVRVYRMDEGKIVADKLIADETASK